jgi:SAM-dependent methyltransferase
MTGASVRRIDGRPTRGDGKLEGFIARLRMDRVLKSIKPSILGTEILDVGCGSHPVFLARAPFRRKVGLDQLAPASAGDAAQAGPGTGGAATGGETQLGDGLELLQLSLDAAPRLPFPDASFSCVTSLAVIEHLEPDGLPGLMAELHRVLKPSGQLLLTTPHAAADGLLRLLARLGLVSKEEIDEHKSLFLHRHIRDLLRQAGFPEDRIRVGGFLLGLNILAVAEK